MQEMQRARPPCGQCHRDRAKERATRHGEKHEPGESLAMIVPRTGGDRSEGFRERTRMLATDGERSILEQTESVFVNWTLWKQKGR